MLVPFAPPRSRPAPPGNREKRHGERELLVVLGIFWVVSVVRVAGALVRHEVFAGEATLALMAVFVIPWLTFGSARQKSERTAPPEEPSPLERRARLRRL